MRGGLRSDSDLKPPRVGAAATWRGLTAETVVNPRHVPPPRPNPAPLNAPPFPASAPPGALALGATGKAAG
jgi:hypothetical protein